MLSQDLKALEVWFKECMEGRAEFTPIGSRAFYDQLRDSREQAELMEASAMPLGGKLTLEHLSSGKVAIFPVVARPHSDKRPDGAA